MKCCSSNWFKPLTLSIGLLVVIVAAVLPLLPEPYRMWNFAMFGALGLFIAARMGFIAAVVFALGGKLLSDMLNYLIGHPGDADYLPIGYVVCSFVFYPLAGLLIRKTEHPAKIAAAALLGSLSFFLVTNSASWLGQSLPYGYTFSGYITCLEMGLPFFRGTLVSDIALSGTLFAAHAVLSRAYFPQERLQFASTEGELAQ